MILYKSRATNVSAEYLLIEAVQMELKVIHKLLTVLSADKRSFASAKREANNSKMQTNT